MLLLVKLANNILQVFVFKREDPERQLLYFMLSNSLLFLLRWSTKSLNSFDSAVRWHDKMLCCQCKSFRQEMGTALTHLDDQF